MGKQCLVLTLSYQCFNFIYRRRGNALKSEHGMSGSDTAAAEEGTRPAVTISSRLEVYWPLDDAWYRGEVVAMDGMQCLVSYDDGRGPLCMHTYQP